MKLTSDNFNAWLADMDPCLEAFARAVPENIRSKLDYSPSSLSVVEAWLLSKYATIDAILKESEQRTLDLAARYVGETYRKHIGGTWTINLADPKRAYYRIPLLKKEGEWEKCPRSFVTASLDRRTGRYIEGVLQNFIDPVRKAAHEAKIAALKNLPLEKESKIVSRDDFEHWLFELDDCLEDLVRMMPQEIASKLDYSPASLSVLEAWLLARYPSSKAILVTSEKFMLNLLSRYVGEVLRKTLGGKWTIDLENRKNANFRKPVIWKEGACEHCPHTLVTDSLDRRTGSFLESLVAKNLAAQLK